ncbi:MAG: cysteine desulfurase family protein, partial [Pirellulaceae bacterium]
AATNVERFGLTPLSCSEITFVQPIYLDFNSTTPVAPSVLEKMQPFWAEHFLLPAQQHHDGHAVAEGLEEARQHVAAMLGCDAFEIVFTSGATEANNLAILGTHRSQAAGHAIISALEHESVWRTTEWLAESGWSISVAEAEPDGVISGVSIQALLREDTRLVCLQAANPVLGTLQPVREVADLCHARGVRLHCDASQLLGKSPVDVLQLRADTVSLSGHKIYGPKGTGALYVRRGIPLSPVMCGEQREMGLRPGAENVPGWIGLGAASMLVARCVPDVCDNLAEIRDRFVDRLHELLGDSIEVLCESRNRLPNTLAIQFTGDAQRIQAAAGRLVFLTARSASPADEMTRCLRAVGRTDEEIARTIRISFGWTTSREQVDRAAELLVDAADYATTSRN